MNGLLGSIDDPRTAGLLGLGLRLMSTPGKFGQALGQAGLGAMGDMRQAQASQDARKRAGLQEQLTMLQLEQVRAQQEQAKNQAQAQAAAEQLRRGFLGSMDSSAGPAMPFDPALALGAGLSPQEVQLLKPKEAEPVDYNKMVIPGPNGPMLNPLWVQGKKATLQPPAVVNVNTTQEKEENKAVGKFYGEQFAELQKSGLSAQGRIDRMNRMEGLLERINTGKFEGVKKEAAAVAQSLGFTIDPNLSDKEAFEALSNQLSLEARSTAEGGGMPGAMSDRDREFLLQITPNLSKTPEGNRTIIQTSKKLAQRQREVAAKARQYRLKNGALDERFFEELQAWSDQNPLFAGSVSAPAQATGLSAAEKAELEQLRARFNRGK